MKKAVLIGLILLITGGALLFGAFALLGFGFDHNFTTRTITVDEDFSSLYADLDETDLTVLPATDGKCTAVLYEHKRQEHGISVKNEALRIVSREKKIIDRIFDVFSFASPKITLYLPKNEYDSLQIESDSGDTTLDKTLTFEKVKIEVDTGDIRLYASVNGLAVLEADTGEITADGIRTHSLDASTDTGHITLKNVSASEGVKIETDTGRITVDTLLARSFSAEGGTTRQSLNNLSVQNGINVQSETGDVRIENSQADSLMLSLSTGDATIKNSTFASTINARASTGDIFFSKVDAKQITAHTNTGDIEGTLLTGKIFDAKAHTGKVRVPESIATESRCKLSTGTGDITITIAP